MLNNFQGLRWRRGEVRLGDRRGGGGRARLPRGRVASTHGGTHEVAVRRLSRPQGLQRVGRNREPDQVHLYQRVVLLVERRAVSFGFVNQ